MNGMHMFAKEKGLNPQSGIVRQWRLVNQRKRNDTQH